MWFVGGGLGRHCRSRGCHMTPESLRRVQSLGSSSSELEGMVVLYREVETRIVSEFCCVGVAELDAQGLAEESFVF